MCFWCDIMKDMNIRKRKNMKIFCGALLAFLALGGILLGILVYADRTSGKEAHAPEAVSGYGPFEKAAQIPDLPPGAEPIDPKEIAGTGSERGSEGDPGTPAETETVEDTLPPAGTKIKDEQGRVTEVILPREEEITLLFAGDILFDDNYTPMVMLRRRANGILDSFSERTLQEMQAADVFIVNNEFPYSDKGSPLPDKNFTFRAKPETVTFLDAIGVDGVTLANNHAYDYGEEALLDTFRILNEDEMPYAGAGGNLTEAMRPMVFRNGDVSVAVFSSTQIERMQNPDTKGATDTSAGVFRCLDDTRLVEAVRAAKQEYDIVIVCVHWGTESTTQLDYRQVEGAKHLAEAGADLIMGDHPHILQGIEKIGDCIVMYSMGNYWFNSSTQNSCLIKVTLTGNEISAWQFLPARQEGCFTSLLEGEDKEEVLQLMRGLSGNVILDEEGYLQLR